MNRRLGILGGTFDPIHCGHLDLGAAAQTRLRLQPLLVIPSHVPPHRTAPTASPFQRFAMVAIAVAGRSGWLASDLELGRDEPSYTSSTLRHFHARGFDAHEIFFVIGADAFAEIEIWKDYPRLLDWAHFVVVSRPGHAVADLADRLTALASRMVEVTDDGDAPAKPSILLIDAPTADVSATTIRQRRASGLPITGMVAPSVERHIEQHGLYTPTRSDTARESS